MADQTGNDAAKGDFHFIVHIANTDLDGNKKSVVALMKIKGLGKRIAERVAISAGIDRNVKLGSYPESKYAEIEEAINSIASNFPGWMVNRPSEFETGESRHAIGTEVDLAVREDINRMKMIRCYKGIRHETGQKVRGQRTRSNGRTGLTMGVTRVAAAPAAGAGGEKAAAEAAPGQPATAGKAAKTAAPAAKSAAPAKTPAKPASKEKAS
ncbi:MAG: 30S ribosomal protein S13 [Candidatus Thermoplasmatota archaeon]|nr:30S ribosomal protein S13 [Candidatus Sysuiplasma jiujiangense]MBX8641622.1 30S ribosomal protein S13 [Candidatus Sysuiplasma jiujiangense]MCL4317585.1 30S ribosomal protein S13 [Candidatus Thermoplasmatota archaeon]MCL5254169.1 30S ribosomal protein S13 [Candidatus Thermoplasmatota archaeon]